MRHLAFSLVVIVITALNTAWADSADSSTGNPIRKVLQLLGDLQKKVISDGEKEQKSYEDYVKWCGKTSREKQFAVKEGTQTKESLEAAIQKASDERDEAITQIQELVGSIATDEADLKAATLLRKKQSSDFQAFDADLDSTIKTLTRAQQVMRKELAKGGIKASFLQRPTAGMKLFHSSLKRLVDAASAISTHSRRTLTALIQTSEETSDLDEDRQMDEFKELGEELGAPKAEVYKSKSTPLLQALEELQDQTAQAQGDARKKEQAAQHNFDMLAQSLRAKIATQNKELDASKKDKAQAEEARADAESKLTSVTKDLKEDQDYLANLQHGCMDRATTFEVEQKTRKTELEALAEAKQAIKEMTGGAESQAYSFLQTRGRLGVGYDTANGQAALKEINRLASRTSSLALTQLASRLSAAIRYAANARSADMGNPFAKIQGVMKSMIAKLEKEAADEANQKEFCDREMKHTQKSKSDKEDEVDDLSAKLESIGSELANLQQAMKTLSEEASDVVKSQSELDRIRAEEHAAYVQARQDFQDGLSGVQVALKVLRQYYAQDGDNSALVQEDMEGKMVSAGSSSSSSASGGASIIGLLEVIESDFAKALSEITEEENSAKEDYDSITQKNRVTKATLDAEVKQKGEDITRLQKRATELQSDTADAQQELDAINDYWEKLQPKCIKEPESYNDRMARRQEEIDGLTQALATLEGESAASSAA